MDLTVEGRHTEVRERWQHLIEKQAQGLARKAPEILHLRVTLIKSPHHLEGAEEVRLVGSIPGDQLVVSKQKKTMDEAIRAAFAALERMLPREPGRHGWTVVKEPAPRLRGTVHQLFPEEGFGFVLLDNGRQAYFHRRSVTGLPFEKLEVGTAVAIDLEQGDKGPQASRVEVM
ncbi:MAG: HPF/RaiA family ribosome-associated protein [Deltaproteobacteria bacterium]|nr:HPF/RaiA family ribosome-associated protein [Deltaproteobacteria bacterium]